MVFLSFLFFFFLIVVESHTLPLLTEEELFDSIKKFEYSIIFFYLPGCKYSHLFLTEFEGAIKNINDYLKDENNKTIYFSRLELNGSSNIIRSLKIEEVPNIYFFKKEKEILVFNGERNANGIFKWIYIETQVKKIEELECEELVLFMQENKRYCILFENKRNKKYEKDVWHAFKQLKTYFPEIKLIASSCETFSFKTEQIYCKYLAKEISLELKENLNFTTLLPIIHSLTYDFIFLFNEDLIMNYLHQNNTIVILWADDSNEINNNLTSESFKNFAISNSNLLSFKFSFAYTIDPLNTKWLNFFGLDKKEPSQPILTILHLSKNKNIVKYILKPTSYHESLTQTEIALFFQKFRNNDLKPFIRSEQIEKDEFSEHIDIISDHHTKSENLGKHEFMEHKYFQPDDINKKYLNKKNFQKLTGLNFSNATENLKKDALVVFCPERFQKCQEVWRIFDDLTDQLAHLEREFTVWRFDPEKNDFDGRPLVYFPTVRLYLKGRKEPLEFQNDVSIENLNNFLRKHLTAINKND